MEFRSDQAIYLQIADLFCENILLEKWNAGDRIPSVREMAVHIEVNPNTVIRTFNYLQDKEIIFNKRGIGYFVSDDGLQKTKALIKENFMNQELPRVFKGMSLLNITMDDVIRFHQQFKESEGEDTDKEQKDI